MSRYYLRYTLQAQEPLILSDGSQIGNVLTTQDYIPGSTMLGVCAGLYLKENNAIDPDNAHENDDFRKLFLSDDTIFSPAYPKAEKGQKCFPMPYSVFGCKYYGFYSPQSPHRKMHGIKDYLFGEEVPEHCPVGGCNDPLEHKSGYCYRENGTLCTHEVSKNIIAHNKVAESSDEKELFAFETLTEYQVFHGEISFSDEGLRDNFYKLLQKYQYVSIGKAKHRGYGRAKIFVSKADKSYRAELGSCELPEDRVFSIYLYSDAILVDNTLNYMSHITSDFLASCLEVKPEELEVFSFQTGSNGKYKSFWKNRIVMGFNQKRRMPLPFEMAISKGSVFTVRYKGENTETLVKKLTELVDNGIGLRRNEGFGQIVVNHWIHGKEVQNASS